MQATRKQVRPLKVFGTTSFLRDRDTGAQEQRRAVVATTSFVKAREALGAHGLAMPTRDYLYVTGNDQEVAAALSCPGTVFGALARFGPLSREYRPVEKGVVGGRDPTGTDEIVWGASE